MEFGLGDALGETRVVAAVCAILRAKGDAKTRELVRHLAESGIQIGKSRLNQILYLHVRTIPGLSVNDHTWHFEQPTTPADSAASPRLAAQAPLATRASDTGPHSHAQPALAAPGGSPVEPPSKPAHFELSLEQRAIVDAEPARWLLVEAGPGTGKTAVALARVATLLNQGVPPSGILMVSFTRTAVAELRQRIEALAKDVAAVAAVRITTLDAEAWNLGVSFQGGRTTEKLARGFDGNIEDAIALFLSSDPALCDWIAQTRHVIIDEAQDLVGRRSELVFQILDHLSNECGVTVFVDPAQSGYAGAVVPLTATAANDHAYLLATEDGIPLGALSPAVNKDLFTIAKAIDAQTTRKPPDSIHFVSLIGVRTYAVADDHPRIAELHEPWATTGIFLVPVIRALTRVYLPSRAPRRNR